MSDDKNQLEEAVDQAVEAFVYAPIGLIFDGPAVFPDLVQRGKQQVQVARMMGEMVVQTGQKELSKRLGPAADGAPAPVRDALSSLGLVEQPKPTPVPDPEEAAASKPAAKRPRRAAPKAAPAKKARAAAATRPAAKKAPAARARKVGKSAASTASDALGIPEYDSLSASQVVQRLRGLVPDELEAVAAYESANRARKTILNRVAQLQKK